jgi:hypothetical protein
MGRTGHLDHRVDDRLSNRKQRTPDAKKEHGLQSASPFELSRTSFASVGSAAAGQTHLEFFQCGLHWRPAAAGLANAGALLSLVAQPRTPALQISAGRCVPNWSLALGDSLDVGCWNLELCTSTPLCL